MLPTFYRFILEIEWDAPLKPNEGDEFGVLAGAYTTRKAAGRTRQEALKKACSNVLKELRETLGARPGYKDPTVDVESSWEVSFVNFWFSGAPNQGFTFYPPEGTDKGCK